MRINKIINKLRRWRVRCFAATYSKSQLEQKLKKRNAKVMLINKGMYEYAYFNFTFLDNMLSSIIDVLSKGYIPFIRLDGRKTGWTNWETFFEQPFQISLNSKSKEEQRKIGLITPTFLTPFNKNNLQLWSKVYTDFAVLNQTTQKYVDDEYCRLLAGKKVIGALCRGTDYVTKKPFGHPVQPEIKDVISLVKQKMQELHLDYIYLATEELRIVKEFENVFPQKIIVNKRHYYDEDFYQNEFTDIYQVYGKHEDEIYERGIEYLSSIYLLSRCDALVAGNCSGSSSAVFLNNGKYRFCHLFNLGFYGIEK